MADMETPLEGDRSPLRKSSRGQKLQASRSPSRSLSPVSKLALLGPSNPVSIMHFKAENIINDAPSTLSEIVLPRTSEDLHHVLQKAGQNPEYEWGEEPARPPMYIMHGLPSDFLDVIGDCMGIEMSFVEAHAFRKAYRPKDTEEDEFVWTHFGYPELVTRVDEPSDWNKEPRISSSAVDVMSQPLVKEIGNTNLRVIFRRVSMWIDYYGVVVVFMDTPLWRNQGLSLVKRNQVLVANPDPLCSTVSHESRSWAPQVPQKVTMPSFEEEFYKDVRQYGRDDDEIDPVIGRLVYNRWLELFEALPSPGSGWYSTDGGDLLWQMMQSVERNLQALNAGARGDGRGVWNDLLRRLQRTLDFATQGTFTNQASTRHKPASPKQELENSHENSGTEAILEGTYSHSELPDWEQINRRSLDRITYLGGILLPLTVVSGILDIEGRYGPEGTQFWVFWVASFVSSSICLFIIYLDQLRSLDIWFEVTANDTVEAMFQQYTSAFSSYQRESGVESVQAAGVAGSASGNALPRVFTNRNGHVAVEEGGKLHYLTSSVSSGRRRRAIWFENSKESEGKTWKKGSLGWGGAVKKTMGYYRFKGGNVRFTRPDDDEK